MTGKTAERKMSAESAAEAVLFACGDPVERARLASSAGIDEKDTDDVIARLNARYDETGSSMTVMRLGDAFQLTVREEYIDNVRAAADNRKTVPLSQAAMEVLTIIAYNQPVTKAFVEHVRGIESSGLVNSLVEKDLLAEAGRLDVPGRPVAYKTTPVFLRCFHLESLDDLPSIPNVEKTDFSDMLLDDDEGGEDEDSG